jgi:outer membrane protein assembly factor BamB
MVRRATLIVVMAAVTALGSPWPSPVLATPELSDAKPSGQWSMFMNGPQRRGITPIIGAQTSTLAWRISTETNYGGAVVGRNGTVYQATFDHGLVALRPDGTVKWTFHTASLFESTPAILPDGRIAFVDDGGNLYVIHPDGSLSWGFQSGTSQCCNETAPAIGRDGTIYTGIDQTIYAFYPDGTIRWTYFGEGVGGAVAVAADGTVYFPSNDLVALDSDGHLLWHSDPLLQLGGSPAVGPDGTIYATANDSTAYAFNPDGTTKWSYQADDCCDADVPASPAIGRDGTIYVGMPLGGDPGVDGVMFAFNPDGSIKWEVHHGRYPTAPALGGDGTIYYGGGSGAPSLYALNPDGTLKWQYDDPHGAYVRTPPAVGQGRVYAGSINGFFAIGP